MDKTQKVGVILESQNSDMLPDFFGCRATTLDKMNRFAAGRVSKSFALHWAERPTYIRLVENFKKDVYSENPKLMVNWLTINS